MWYAIYGVHTSYNITHISPIYLTHHYTRSPSLARSHLFRAFSSAILLVAPNWHAYDKASSSKPNYSLPSFVRTWIQTMWNTEACGPWLVFFYFNNNNPNLWIPSNLSQSFVFLYFFFEQGKLPRINIIK